MLIKQTQYNLWANQIICDLVLKAGETKSDMHQVASFPSIRKTLIHIWDGQIIWFYRLNGTSLHSFPGEKFNGTLQDAVYGLHESSQLFVTYAKKNEANYGTSISYQTMDKQTYYSRIDDIIFHCMNHSTYHRGQIINLLRGAGFTEIASTDYMRFCRSNL